MKWVCVITSRCHGINCSFTTVIVKQNPSSACDGLMNLINTTLPNNVLCDVTNISSSVDCNHLTCYSTTSGENLMALTLLPRDSAVILFIGDGNGSTALNRTLRLPQQIQFTRNGVMESLNFSVEVVVASDQDLYYIISQESSFGFNFPMTAVPLVDSIPG